MTTDEVAVPPAMPPGRVRVFLALLPTPAVVAALAAHGALWQWGERAVRYAPPDWHLTLHFLGAVARDRLPALLAALPVNDVAPFELTLGQAEVWPQGIAVLCPLTVPAGLQRLHERLAVVLRQQGWPLDPRPFRPHVTLARQAHQAVPPARCPAWAWPVSSYALLASTGEPGSRYRVLQSLPFSQVGP